MHKSTRVRARVEVLAAALLFSTGGAAVKACSLGGWQIACARSLIAGATLAVLLPGLRRGFTRTQLAVAVPYAGTLLLYVLATKLTTAANAIFLQSTAPLYLLLISPRWLGEPIRRRDLVFMSALAVGLALFFLGMEAPQRTAPEPLLGNLLAAASGLTWALTVAGLRLLARDPLLAMAPEAGVARDAVAPDPGGVPPPHPAQDGAARATLLGNLLVAAIALPFALARPWDQAGLADLGVVVYLGVAQIALAYFFLTRAIRRLSALESALLLLIEPVLNTLWTWLFHGEVPGPWSATGALVILMATAAHTIASARTSRASAPIQ